MTLEIDSVAVCRGMDGKTIMIVNDAKRGAAILKQMTTPLPQTERRRKWSASLVEADGWMQLARSNAKRRDYRASCDAALCVIRAMEAAMIYEEPAE